MSSWGRHDVAYVCGVGLNARSIVDELERLGWPGSVAVVAERGAQLAFVDRPVRRRHLAVHRFGVEALEAVPADLEAALPNGARGLVFFTDERLLPAFARSRTQSASSRLTCYFGNPERLDDILDRVRFYQAIERLPGVTVPQTIPGNADPFAVFGDAFMLRARVSWQPDGRRLSVKAIRGRAAFDTAIQALASAGIARGALCFQEMLSTRSEDNVSVCGWYDADDPQLIATRKVLQHPDEVGDGDLVEVIEPPNGLIDQALGVLESLEFVGPFELEFVRNPSTIAFCVIELNPRFWLQHGLAEARLGLGPVTRYAGFGNRKGWRIVANRRYWVNPGFALARLARGDVRPVRHVMSGLGVAPIGFLEAVFVEMVKTLSGRPRARLPARAARVDGPSPGEPHIVQLSVAHRRTDERILNRMAETALEAGFRSTYLVADGHATEVKHGVTVASLNVPASHRVPVPLRFRRSLAALSWCMRNDADVVQVHDPELLPVASLLRLLGRKVIYDVHDDYHASIVSRFRRNRVTAALLAACWDAFELVVSRWMSGVVVADRHLARRFKASSPVVLGNYPPLDFIPASEPSSSSTKETFNLLYVGGVTRERGLAVALEALDLLGLPDVRLHVVGSGREHALLEALERHPQVVVHGRVDWRDLHHHYAVADVGLALYQPLPTFQYSPGENAVKVIEYMAAGIPVVTADFPGLRAFVSDSGAGLVTSSDDPGAVASVLKRLHADHVLCQRLGARGRELFETKYNWDMHAGALTGLYRRVLGESDRPMGGIDPSEGMP